MSYKYYQKPFQKQTLLKALKQEGDSFWGAKETYRLHLRERDKKFFEKYISNPDGVPRLIEEDPQNMTLSQKLNQHNTIEGGIENLLKKDAKTLKEESQRNIRDNCELLFNKIKNYFKTDDEIEHFVGDFLFSCCYLIVVSVADQTSAFRIFSLMNSTGLDLLPTDIIKADIIGKIPEGEKELYAEKWEDLENDTSLNGFYDMFAHIRMIEAKKKAEKSLLEEFKEKVLVKYQNNPKAFIDNVLTPYTVTYCYLKTKWNTEESSLSIKHSLMWLNKIDNSDWLPVALEYVTRYQNNVKAKEKFLRKLERLASYLHITARDINKRVDRYKIILDEMEKNASPDLSTIELTPEEKKVFQDTLNGEIYSVMVAKRRNYLILRLDFAVSDKSKIIEYNPSSLTVEHILPQTPEGTEWEQLWPVEEKRKYWVHRIGNLLPLNRKANSAAKNWSFKHKKAAYFLNPKAKTASYALTTQVLNFDTWTESEAVARQRYLLDILIKEWNL
ncbi:MAG: DUF1524 domain-containing protein [Spirochaetia bacterium]|uniref:DUF262 domain-containing protein n=1 Tax=Candidatus Avelusimicrobium fimicolum TaxID=3416216 RepID=UPI003C83BB9B|nr:DUF1524 domain-containing protein [Spirochaetia bacterium]